MLSRPTWEKIMSLLEINNIDVSYGDVQVIFDLSLKVEKGEVVSIIGGNGAGKSTLLRAISGLMPASSGSITFNGVPIQKEPPENVVDQAVLFTFLRGGGCFR